MKSNIMEKLNKQIEPITTLVIIYLALVTISIALYALIQIYVDDKSTASNLLSWTATLFATIALLYTFNSWREQKGSDVLSRLAEECFYKSYTILDKIEDLNKDYEYNLKYKLNNKCRFDLKKIELIDIEIEDLSKKIKLITDEKPNKDIEVSLVNLKHNYNKLFIKLVEFDESINSNDISTDKILENYKITFKELNLKNLVSLSIINHKLMDYIFHRK
ncbi:MULTISPECIES: hypothetical protein [Acinetobacter]|uniref:hypothetical protein n=1 Tax=Acinetobacter TaxID=469 RepID=UPI001D0DB5A5|nr:MULTISPECIES: hypothetical protein [Acinetobacter]